MEFDPIEKRVRIDVKILPDEELAGRPPRRAGRRRATVPAERRPGFVEMSAWSI